MAVNVRGNAASAVVAVVIGVLALLALGTPTARANVYPIFLCNAGYGTSAFSSGWSSSAGSNLRTAANCTQPTSSSPVQETGDGMQAWSVNQANGAMAGAYWLRAPTGTAITDLYFTGAFSSFGGWVAHWATGLSGGGDPVPDCGATQSCTYNSVVGKEWPVNNASLIGFGLWCDASTCGKNASGSLFGPAGSANVFTAVVYINEPSAPSLTIGGSVYGQNPTGWISDRNAATGQPWAVDAQASDPAGVCNLSVQVGPLSASSDVTPNYGSGTATPCATGTPSAMLNLNPCQPGGLPAGKYTSSASAQNAANMTSTATGGLIQVECSGPSVNITSTQNLANWYSGQQSVVVNASDQSGLQGNLTCTVGPSGNQQTVTFPASQLPYTLPVTGNGANDVSCTAENNVNYTTTAGLGGQLLIDNQAPTVTFGGSQPSPAWVTGPQTVTVTGSEQQPLSGIRSVSCQVDGGGWTTTSGATANVPVSGDGTHTLDCYSTTGAGVQGAAASYSLQIDSTPPTLSFSGGPSQTSWSTRAQSISVTAVKPQGSSGVAEISCTLNQQTTAYDNSGSPSAMTVLITVQPPGGVLSCRALDNAGNWSGPQGWSFLIDDAPPTGIFEPPDPVDPARVTVDLRDAGSGAAGAQIELQTATGWRQLPTTVNGNVATATIPDDGTVPDGTYNLQALVWDTAGNEATVTLNAAGTPEAVTLPLRIVTRLEVTAPSANLGARVAVATARAERRRLLALRYGQTATVLGLLETIDGTPIPGQRISVSQQAAGWPSQPRGGVTTDAHGRFRYRVAAGASRRITFSYAGTGVLRESTAATSVNVVGKAGILVGRTVSAGLPLRITGRIFGGYVPPGGVLVQLQYRVVGVPVGWAPFEQPVQTDPTGRWGLTFPVATGARSYTYLFRALVSRQSGWPFLTATSNIVARHVH